MIYRKLDEFGDYIFGGNLSNFFKDQPEAVAQSVVTRLKLWEGEWFLDIIEGTPYIGGMLGKYTLADTNNLIKERILNTEGVIEITEYSSNFDPDLRKFSVSVTISTIYGEATITEAL